MIYAIRVIWAGLMFILVTSGALLVALGIYGAVSLLMWALS